MTTVSYRGGEASSQSHLQVSFESDQRRHQDEQLCYHLEHLPVLGKTHTVTLNYSAFSLKTRERED